MRNSLPDAGSAAAFLIPFALIVYLGMERGGFEQPVYSEIGIAAWWLVGVGILAAALPTARVGRSGWIALALLAAFAGWTAIGISWSSSSGRSVVEVARVLVYVGVFAVALLIGGRGRLRITLGGVAAGCATIAVVALLSRLHPSWFPENELPQVLVGVQSRLAYPVGYWNALAGLIAIGLPLLLWAVHSARSIGLRSLAAAAIPAVALAGYFTYSRGGLVATAIAVAVLVLLSERRLSLIAPFATLAIGSGIVVWQASIRHQLSDGLTTDTAGAQGDSMLIIVAGVGAIAAAAIAVLAVLERRETLPRAPAVPRRIAGGLSIAAVLVAVVAFVAVGGPGEVSDGFEEFKQPTGLSDTSSRLESVAGNGRWQYWSAAADAGADDPLQGIGPGTFVFYWQQFRDIDNGFVRDAHSLFVEVFAELGTIGVVLIGGFVLFVLGAGLRRLFAAAGERRNELAAALAAAVGFTVAVAVDWLWELAVIPVAFLLVAAAIVRSDDEPEEGRRPSAPLAARIAVPVLALGAIFVIGVPMLSDERVTRSQEDFRAGDLDGALEEAETAADLEPYSAAPRLQMALVYERMDPPALKKAASAAQAAVERESTNWETWYVLSRIQAQREGKRGSALRALREAQSLDPFNPLLDPEGLSG